MDEVFINSFLLTVASFIILMSILVAYRLNLSICSMKTRNIWKIQIAIIFLFFIGYTSFLTIINIYNYGKEIYLPVLIFLLGAVYVFLSIKITAKIIKQLIIHNSILEEKVRQRTSELVLKNNKLKNIVEEKHNLIRLMSHDFNNTLMVIISTTVRAKETLKEIDKYQAKLWNNIEKASDIQKELMDQVRYLEALSTGKCQIFLEPVNVYDSLDKILFLFNDRLEEKNLIFQNNIPKDIEVVADEKSLSNTVFSNLISNAIKFSKEEGVISANFLNSNDDYIHISICDSGIGIPFELVKKIFDPNTKTTRKGTNNEQGTGFGMPLVKSLIDRYNADIEIKTRPIEGFPVEHGTSIILKFLK